MFRKVLGCLLTLLAVSGVAAAGENHYVLRVARPVGTESLRSAGLLYLADLGSSFLVQGDEKAVQRLAASGADFRLVLSVEPDERLLLLKARNPTDEMFYSRALAPLGRGMYLAAARADEDSGPGPVPFSIVTLAPADFPKPSVAVRLAEPVEVYPKPAVRAMVAAASPDSLLATIAALSGEVPVVIGGTPDTLLTRYSYSPEVDRAAEYLGERMEAYGLDVEFHDFAVSTHDLFSASFVDAENGWLAGGMGRVYRTADGGQTWVARHPEGSFTLWGVSFVDTLTGWVVGNSGTVQRTDDGGASWMLQSTPNTLALRAVCFLDSLTGFAAGASGMMLHTSDGGRNWISVPSGTSDHLYDIHFQSESRGWACGRNGALLYWDGTSWSPRESGADLSLMGIYFSDDSAGYAVGSAATVLRTVNAGEDWVPRPTPPDVNPYFESVCFTDSVEGWCVGLGGTILHTEDGGLTWERQVSGALFGLVWVEFVSPVEGWTGGYGGTILHTVDAGETWESQKANLPPEAVTVLRNVVGTLEGAASGEEVVICGHFDSISEDPMNRAPGADDNASGTAAVIEAARVLSPHTFQKTIRLICFSGEEIGLQGSGAYAPEARLRGDEIAGVLNLDMIGYADAVPEDVDLIANPASEWLLDFTAACAEVYVPGLPTEKIIDATYLVSDHASFWRSGYRALLAIEDADIVYPHYHTTGDTLGNLTMSLVRDITRMGIAVAAELAVPASVTAAGERAGGPVLASRVFPSPFRGSTGICFVLGGRSHVDIRIYGVDGRLVRALAATALPAGEHEIEWDGRDSRGQRLSPGIYFARIATPGGSLSSKVLLLR
jgi:photosystem II stability/assembly factor-like uncharacterized protein